MLSTSSAGDLQEENWALSSADMLSKNVSFTSKKSSSAPVTFVTTRPGVVGFIVVNSQVGKLAAGWKQRISQNSD